MITFYSSGQLGDIIYSLPAVKRLCEVKNAKAKIFLTSGYFGRLKKFLNSQEYIDSVELYLCQDFLYNLDDFRFDNPDIFDKPLILSYLRAFGLPEDNFNEPWLTLDSERLIEQPYNIINVTNRYRGYFDWEDFLKTTNLEFIFVGLSEEFEEIKKIDTLDKIKYHYQTSNVYEVANLVKYADSVYCNQSMVLTLSQGFGKEYYLDLCLSPIFYNVLLGTKNEHILNNEEFLKLSTNMELLS